MVRGNDQGMDGTTARTGHRGRAASPSGRLALTLKQPWAGLIFHGGKNVENRTWKTNYRGHLWIHAGGTIDHRAAQRHPVKGPTSAILGFVTLVDVVRNAPSPWAEPNHWHWLLADPHLLDTPIPMRGAQGLWSWQARQPREHEASRDW